MAEEELEEIKRKEVQPQLLSTLINCYLFTFSLSIVFVIPVKHFSFKTPCLHQQEI